MLKNLINKNLNDSIIHLDTSLISCKENFIENNTSISKIENSSSKEGKNDIDF
jgi:hypothetical protein